MSSDLVEYVRAVDDLEITGGVVEGLAARWDRPYRVSNDGGQTYYEEVWRQGAASKSIRERKTFELRFNHGEAERVGATEFYERTDGLHFRAEIEEDQAELRQAARDGNLTDVSVRFAPIQTEQLRSDRVLITEAKLRELSLVQGKKAQYPDAKIEAVRADEVAEEVLRRRHDLVARTQAAIRAASGHIS